MPPRKLSVYEFGRALIESNDLDPVYVLIAEADFDRSTLEKWLLAYWCFYHIGTASWIADSDNYWMAMRKAAESPLYPRCRERRHFRGSAAVRSVEWLAKADLENLFRPFHASRSFIHTDVMDYVQTWNGFGPWIAFKVADMVERLGITKIQFDSDFLRLFDSPREGAIMLWKAEWAYRVRMSAPIIEDERFAKPDNLEAWAVERLTRELSDLKAPPTYDRPIGVQEAETVLCKWKSYMRNKYKLGEDVHSCRECLKKFPDSPTNKKLEQVGRDKQLW